MSSWDRWPLLQPHPWARVAFPVATEARKPDLQNGPRTEREEPMTTMGEAWVLWTLDVADAVLERHRAPRMREGL